MRFPTPQDVMRALTAGILVWLLWRNQERVDDLRRRLSRLEEIHARMFCAGLEGDDGT